MTARTPHPRKPRPPKGAARVIEESSALDDNSAPIVERPDGFYWSAPDGRQEFGPFDTVELARADRDRFGETEPGETLQEAESELGMSGWIDPDSGQPAEGQSSPRLEEE